ncbi:MAG: protein BatD [Flavobacteriales bacterium]|nr:MAG: protein BatD [Flavobacteriales bacterium]
MVRMLKHLLILLPALMVVAKTHAQEITFQAQADRNTIATGEYVKYTVTLTNSRERIEVPDLGGLMVVQGPFDNSSFSIFNGRMSGSVSRTWVLTATSPGKYTIGPARVRVGGGIIATEPITIEVSKNTSGGTDPNAAQGQSRDPNLFTTISLSKNKAYVGEQVIATYTLYSRYSGLETTNLEMPKMDGFWAENVELGETNWDPQLKNVNGLQYRTAVIKKQVLFPQRPGKLKLAPFTMECVVNRSFFNRGTAVEVRSNAAELTVTALPPNAPAAFNGAVGELDLVVKADRTEVKANEAIELSITYTGRGNLKLMEAPALRFPSDFDTYDPKVNDRITVSGSGMSGQRSYQYLIIPRHEGEFALDPFVFSFFDTRTGAYRTVEVPAMAIHVSPGEGGTITVQRPNKSDVQVLGKDIRYIRSGDLGLRPADGQLFGSWPWLAGMVAPGIGLVLFLAWRRKRQGALNDVAGRRRKQADRVARQRLNEASLALQSSDRKAFYDALGKALHGYVADKFGLGQAGLNAPELTERLGHYAGGEAIAAEYVALTQACDMARYAPVEDRPRQALYDEAVALIGRTEQLLRA